MDMSVTHLQFLVPIIICATNETESETQKIKFITMVGAYYKTIYGLLPRFRSSENFCGPINALWPQHYTFYFLT